MTLQRQPIRNAAPPRVPDDARRSPVAGGGASDAGPLFEEPQAEPGRAQAEAPKRPTITVRITAAFDGFPVELEALGTLDQVPAMIKRVRELGGAPPVVTSPAAVEAEAQREAPVCKYHGPMVPSTKAPGTWFCRARMGDGSYCREKHPA